MDSNPAIYDKSMQSMFSLWNPRAAENWGYTTVPQPGLNGRTIDIARGKVLGGSSSINAMISIRGNRRDFDAWGQLGNHGWTYEEVLPYFKKSETYHGPASPYHGDNGPVSVIDYPNPSPVSHAFVEAAAALGATQKYIDFNAATQEGGAGFYQSTRTIDGIRVSGASAFVRPILERKNFQLLSQARATRLIFEQERVRGIEYTNPDGLHTLRAEREIALCCGAFETPKLMLLSGLGPAEQLATHDIPVVQNLPGVGRNLQDHMLLGVGFESLIPLDPPELLAEAGLFTWTQTGSNQNSPNLQYFFGPVQFLAQEYMTSAPGFTFAPILSQPQSRGTVTLASRDPIALAHVDPQYLSHDEDLAILEYGIRYARELAHTDPFNNLRGRELAPGEAVTSTSELHDYIRRVAGTVWHPVGTCKMGTDQEAVVDDQLRVHGVQGLRIVDASVMPTLVNGNPNAAIMMIAEKAADLIRYDRKLTLHP
jgi:choline dehydrogenase